MTASAPDRPTDVGSDHVGISPLHAAVQVGCPLPFQQNFDQSFGQGFDQGSIWTRL
jgi:hypothetical protein